MNYPKTIKTDETDQLVECDLWKVDPDDKPYQRMMSLASDMERERDAARDRARLAEQREKGNLEAYWKMVGALRDLHDAITARMSADDPSPEDRLALWSAWKKAGQMLPENSPIEPTKGSDNTTSGT